MAFDCVAHRSLENHGMNTWIRLPITRFVLMLATASAPVAAEARSAVARSPDGRNTIELVAGNGDTLQLSVRRGERAVLEPAPLSMRLAGRGDLAAGGRIEAVEEGQIDETFDLLWGKTARVEHRGTWTRVRLAGTSGVAWQIELRAYDDGVAY